MKHGVCETKSDIPEVVIVSKYFVPNSNVDTNAVYDLIVNLRSINKLLKINVVTTQSNYKASFKLKEYDQDVLNSIKTHSISFPKHESKNKILTLLFGLFEGFFLILKARRLKVKNIICLSNPPLINLWANIILKKKNYYYWSFDLYPDAFVADGLLSSSNLFFKILNYYSYRNKPFALLALGDRQFEYLTGKFKSVEIEKLIIPCGIHQKGKSKRIPEWYDTDKIMIGYIGNIGRAHSLYFLLNLITTISKFDNFKLVLSVYGFHAKRVLSYLKNNKSNNIEIIEAVQQNELGYIDIHLVSLNELWTNVSVPSKAVSAICAESALWFNGSEQSDTYNMFNTACYYSESDEMSISDVLSDLNRDNVVLKKENARLLKNRLLLLERETLSKLNNLL